MPLCSIKHDFLGLYLLPEIYMLYIFHEILTYLFHKQSPF